MCHDPYRTSSDRLHILICVSIVGSGDMVVVADPEYLEEVLRAEGKYPQRDKLFGPKVTWFAKEFGVPAILTE